MPPRDKTIASLNAYYADMQRLAFSVRDKDKSPVRAVIAASLDKKSLYMSGAELDALANRLEELMVKIVKQSRERGAILSGDVLEDWMKRQEKSIERTKKLGALKMLNNRQAAARLSVYKKQMARETDLLGKDLDLFTANALAAGRTKAQVLSELMSASMDNQGIVAGFENRAAKITAEASLREAQSAAMDEYRQAADPDEPWVWIAVSEKPCPDCEARAGVELPYNDWVEMGLPGTGRTICLSACRCQLVPHKIADSEFDDIRSFKWDKENLVLTTFSEARRFSADGNKSDLVS